MFRIRKVKSAVYFHSQPLRHTQNIHLHEWIRTKWNINAPIQHKQPLSLRKSVQETKQESLRRAASAISRRPLFHRCTHKQIGGRGIDSFAPQPSYGIGECLILAN